MKRAFMIPILAVLAACAGPGDFSGKLCGNGNLNFGEACDGELFSNEAPFTCVQLGYNSPGRAACGPDCQIDPAPCEDSGRCGDGFATPFWEACDGKDNGGETCASLGFHGGRLFCRENCQFDISRCLRCGDGVVSPEFGELMESGPLYCLDEGWFGGSVYTDDCVAPTEDRCGDYALLEPAGSATRPVVSWRPDGSVQVRARATGSYPGFPDTRGWCPVLAQVYDLGTEPPQVVGWRHDPICEREVLAVRAPGAAEEIRYQHEEDAPVVRQMELGDGGQVVLRQSARSLRLERVDPKGGVLISSRLELDVMFSTPQVALIPGGTVGVSSVALDGLTLAVFDPSSGAVRRLGTLDHVVIGAGEYRPEPTLGHRVAWRSGRECWVHAQFNALDGAGGVPALVRLVDAGGGRLEVSDLIRVGVPAPVWGQNLQRLRLVDDRLELTLVRNDVDAPGVSRVVFLTDGTKLFDKTSVLPSGSRVEAVFVADDGAVVLAGVAPSASDPDPAAQRCRSAETSLVRWRLSAELASMDTRHFRTTAARWDFSAEPDFCATWARTYDYRDGALVVAGAYSRREGFCSDRDRPPVEKTLPVHTCGIYLVKFE